MLRFFTERVFSWVTSGVCFDLSVTEAFFVV